MNKKGLADFILRVFSILTYIVVLTFALLVLNLTQCSRADIADIVNVDDQQLLNLQAREQLTSYLRTPIPEDLVLRIETIGKLHDVSGRAFQYPFIDDSSSVMDLRVNRFNGRFRWNEIPPTIHFITAFQFTDAHPELYLDKTYAEFIAGLEPFYFGAEKENAEITFDVVTRVVFIQSVEERLGDVYQSGINYSPRIFVKFNAGSATDFSGEGDVFSKGDFKRNVLKNTGGLATTVIPALDRDKILVKHEIRTENIIMRQVRP